MRRSQLNASLIDFHLTSGTRRNYGIETLMTFMAGPNHVTPGHDVGLKFGEDRTPMLLQSLVRAVH